MCIFLLAWMRLRGRTKRRLLTFPPGSIIVTYTESVWDDMY